MGQFQSKKNVSTPDNCITQLIQYHNILDNFPQTAEVVNIQFWIEKTIITCKIHSNGKIDLKTHIECDLKYIKYLLEEYAK
jgi:hypothetical protein